MLYKSLILIAGCLLFVYSPAEGQSGKLALEEKIKQDMILMDRMIRNLRRGTDNVQKLEIIDKKILRLWSKEQDAILIGEKPFTENIYDEAKDAIAEFLPRDAEKLADRLDSLKMRYAHIEDERQYSEAQRKFKKLKRYYKKNSVGFGIKLRAILKLRRFIKKELDNESTDITGMLIVLGELLTVVDEYAEEIGIEKLTKADLKILRDDPLDFLVIKANKYLDIYKMSKDTLRVLNERKSKLTDSLYQIEQLYRLTLQQKQDLSEKNEALKVTSEKELQILQQKLNTLNIQLSEQQNIIQSLANKRSNISKEVNTLANQRVTVKEDVDALKAGLTAAEDSLNIQQNKLVFAQKNLVETKFEAETLYNTVDSLTIAKAKIIAEKETVERGRMIFLISSIVMLFALLAAMAYERYRIQERNKKLREEKEKLERSLEMTEEFYAEYRELDKTELALQKEKHTRKLQEYDDLSKLELAIQKNELEEITELQDVTLTELKHRTAGNLQKLLSILGIREYILENETIEEKMLTRSLRRRIVTFGYVNQGLYREAFKTDRIVSFNIKTYINETTSYLRKNFKYGDELKITTKVDKEDILINADMAMPLGLIISEVITNILKYAFMDHPNPYIHIEFGHTNDEQLYLAVQDNGATPDNEGDRCPREDPVAQALIEACAKELEGKFIYKKRNGGLRYLVRFPKSPKYKKCSKHKILHHER